MKKPDFEKIKERQEKLSSGWVRVGMSTCGIAAGADRIYGFLGEHLKKNRLDINLRKCGCLGACYAEPLVEVEVEGMPRVLYGNVNEEMALRIIKEHIIGGRILDSGVYHLRTSEPLK